MYVQFTSCIYGVVQMKDDINNIQVLNGGTDDLQYVYFSLTFCCYRLKTYAETDLYRNYAETVPFHKISTPENYLKLRYFTQ